MVSIGTPWLRLALDLVSGLFDTYSLAGLCPKVAADLTGPYIGS